jgi:hypothetical protein
MPQFALPRLGAARPVAAVVLEAPLTSTIDVAGWRVYRAANEPKRIELFPQGTHDNLFDQGVWEKTQAFMIRWSAPD